MSLYQAILKFYFLHCKTGTNTMLKFIWGNIDLKSPSFTSSKIRFQSPVVNPCKSHWIWMSEEPHPGYLVVTKAPHTPLGEKSPLPWRNLLTAEKIHLPNFPSLECGLRTVREHRFPLKKQHEVHSLLATSGASLIYVCHRHGIVWLNSYKSYMNALQLHWPMTWGKANHPQFQHVDGHQPLRWPNPLAWGYPKHHPSPAGWLPLSRPSRVKRKKPFSYFQHVWGYPPEQRKSLE